MVVSRRRHSLPPAPRIASPCRAAAQARLLLPPPSCHQPCKSKARKSEGRATSAMESVQSQIAQLHGIRLVHSAAAGLAATVVHLHIAWLGVFLICTLPCHNYSSFLTRQQHYSPYSGAKSQILTPMCCYGFLYLLKY